MDSGMRYIEVDSDILRAVGYDHQRKILEIEFRNGHIYQYTDVPEREYQSLIIAMSKGKYFLQKIDGQYRFVRVR